MEEISKDTILRAQQGNMEAFEMIYKITSGYLYNITYRIINSKEEAQEATQDTYVKIFRNLPKFRFQSSFKTWIYRIAVNTAINTYRKKSKDMSRRAEYSDDVATKPAPDSSSEKIDREERSALLRSMLNMLNPDQRACVVLRDIEGMHYREIADVLEVNINTVRSRLKRAREALMSLKKKRGDIR
jgi:RNA polymerase sigma-70 factor (ECF subfamily)